MDPGRGSGRTSALSRIDQPGAVEKVNGAVSARGGAPPSAYPPPLSSKRKGAGEGLWANWRLGRGGRCNSFLDMLRHRLRDRLGCRGRGRNIFLGFEEGGQLAEAVQRSLPCQRSLCELRKRVGSLVAARRGRGPARRPRRFPGRGGYGLGVAGPRPRPGGV